MTTLLYGSIIQIRSTETIYENKLFYVERLEEDELVLKSNDGNTLILPVEDGSLGDSITEIVVLYKPLHGYSVQNKLFKSQWVEIVFEDQKVKGQILKADEVIEVELTNGETVYIPVDRGLPKDVVIKKISRPHENQVEVEVEESPNNGEPLGFIEEDEDVAIQYFYSIEQQTSDLLEHLMMYIPEQDVTPKLKSKFFKMIQRYKELRTKYTDFTDGIHIKKLPTDQLLSNAFMLTSRMYVPVSKDIMVNHYDNETVGDIGEYFRKVESDDPNVSPFESEIRKITDKIHRASKFDEQYKSIEEVAINHAFKTLQNKRRYMFTPRPIQDVYLYEMPNLIYTMQDRSRYRTRVDKPFLVNSLMMQPISYIHYSKVYDVGSSILNKINLNTNRYYSIFYKGKKTVVQSKSKNLYFYNKYLYYENQAPNYVNYLQEIIPSFKKFVDTAIDNDIIQRFYNLYQFINEMSVTNIRELKLSEYIIANAYIKSFIKEILEKYKPEKLQEKTPYRFINNPISDKMTITYKELMPKELLNIYFSSSELFKIGEMDNYEYFKGTSMKEQPKLDITDAEISAILEDIKTKVQEPVEETVSKVYKTEEERVMDRLPILLKQVEKRSGIEHIHKQLIELGQDITIDELAVLIERLIRNGLKLEKGIKREIGGILITLIAETKINEGDKAYVEETRKTYTWDGKKWQDVEADPTCMIKRKLYKGDCGSLEKEVEYNERIARLMFDIEQDKRREKEVNAVKIDLDIETAKRTVFSLNSKKMKTDLKYHEEKRIYGVLAKTDKVVNPESPYNRLRDKILVESDLNLKYKAMQIFIQQYTKRGNDIHWFYCIETGVKLMPTFFSKLADAYLRTNNYENVMEEICLHQGTKSDNGDMWVDKHSGYVIKEINFEEDEFGREEVMADKPKVLFDDIVLEELQLQREINTNLKSLLFYLGVYAEEIDLYPLIFKTYNAISEGRKNDAQLVQARLLAVITHALVYVQTSDVKLSKPFPNCKFSFEGYPITDSSNLNGVNYVTCVVAKLSKTAPWDVFSKVAEDKLKGNILAVLSTYVVPMIEIQELIIKKRMGVQREERVMQTDWKNFSPRLNKFTPVTFEVSKLMTKHDYLDQAYYYSYVIQGLIHKHVAEQEFLLRDKQTVPYLVNTCCNVNNNVYRYFVEHAGIGPILDRVIATKKRIYAMHYYLLGTRAYFIENTRQPTSEPSTAFDEKTIYTKLLSWSQTNPRLFDEFHLVLPHMNKLDNTEKRIQQLKANLPITQETFVAMLQKATTSIPTPLSEPDDKPDEDEIVSQLESPNINDILFGMLEAKLADLGPDKALSKVAMFNRTCKRVKTNLVISDKIEHFTHLNQILYNQIRSLLYTFPEMIQTNKTGLDDICRKYWKLSEVHEKDIANSVQKYYGGLLALNHDEKMKMEITAISLARYVNLMKIKLENQETMNLLYHYIFISILDEYKNKTSRNIDEYLKVVLKIFESEDRALNYDTSTVEYETNLSKKSETQIKTDYFKNLSLEERKSENVLKEHRLDKWGVGLQKSMFKYDKNTYLTDKMSAQEVINGLKEAPEIDEQLPVVEEEGYDIDERPEDDDDVEYEEED